MTPINLGTGVRYKMTDVAQMVFKILGWTPKKISFDTSKPTGAVSRALYNSLAKELLGWEPRFSLQEGLKKTIEWYTKNLKATIDYEDETWAMLRAGGCHIALTLNREHPPHIAFEVDSLSDIPNITEKIREHRDVSKYLYMEDSEGNIIEWIFWNKLGE